MKGYMPLTLFLQITALKKTVWNQTMEPVELNYARARQKMASANLPMYIFKYCDIDRGGDRASDFCYCLTCKL